MIDAIIISDSGNDTFSASSPLRLQLDGKMALIQNVRNYVSNNGKIVVPVEGENERNWHCAPKLNGIRILSYLHTSGLNIELIDSYYSERDHFIHLLDDNPRAVVISTTFISNKKDLRELVDDIRALAPDIFIVAGGPFVFSSYLLLKRSNEKDYDVVSPKDDFLFLNDENNPDVDLYIIDKYGEQLLPEALSRIKAGKPVNPLPNTAHRNGNDYVFADRKELPPPDIGVDWDHLPEKVFELGVINIQASTGCPFNCEFCNFVKNSRYNFIKPLDQLILELKKISGRGVKYVRFIDDNFRLGRTDLNDVCNRFIEEGIDLKWMSFIRASTLENTDFELLKKAGCVEAQIGIESADRTILEKMNKHADPDMYHRAISSLLDIGINCSSCFFVGFPGETDETFNRTIDFIDRIPKDTQAGIFFWSIYPFLVLPLSPVYESDKKAKYQLKGYMDKWEHSTMNSEQAYRHIKNAFMKIKNASPIYSGDNIDMLMELPVADRKEFMRVRHDLSKRFLTDAVDKSVVLQKFDKIIKG
jgi:radical SAM superfamily enzyme YgiQ (UPF0313 family)